MLRPAAHLCLVYNTATANVTPALDPDFHPQEVILLYSPDKAYRARCLEAALKPAGIQVSHWPIEDARDIEHIRERVLELLIEREGKEIALNASGGTRPMSMAAYEIFQEFNQPIFYVHPETDYVVWIHRRDLPSFNVADRIKLPAFLQAHGAEVSQVATRHGIPQHLRRLTQELIARIEFLAKPLITLNWLAQQAEKDLVSPALTEGQRHWRDLITLIERFAAEDLLIYRDDRLHFKDETSRFFVNGGWLEEHIFGLLFGLRAELPKIQDIGRGVELMRDSTGRAVKNELDVAFLYNNHLYIIECKTKRFNVHVQATYIDTPGADALYKLDTLKGLLGDVHTQVMLSSYHPLSQWDKQRADDLGIAVCAGRQLLHLKEKLKQWIVQ